MDPDDRLSAIADRIADGSAIDWPADSSGTNPGDRALLEQLKTIAELATLHRRPVDGAPDLNAPDGTPWGPLTITSKIGEGRFGQVYLAWDARLQRRVALKLLRAASPAASASPTHAIEEARLLARVRHPNVLAVHGAECIDGQIGIWTEFIEGRTLDGVIDQRGPLPPAEVATIGLDLCRALQAVHDAGLLHRDIKAQNVMRETGGRIVLMDFGTGHDLEARPTKAGDMTGTPLYLAPEILAGGEATQASDVYALAVLLFRLLTGEYPVSGRTLADVQAGHREGSAARLGSARPELPPRLVAAIDCGLAADLSRRHESAVAFETALADSDAPDLAPRRRSAGLWTPIWRPAVILLAVTVLVAAAFVLSGSQLASEWARVPLTFESGSAVADISRDGRVIVSLRKTRPIESRHYDEIWIYDTQTRQESPVFVADVARPDLWGATMTPDGGSIDVLDVTGELWRVPVSGRGEPRWLARHVASAPGWAPDGKHMAVLMWAAIGPGLSLTSLNSEGGDPRVLATRTRPLAFVGMGYAIEPATNRPSWSPDGRTIALAGLTFADDQSVSSEVILVNATTGVQQGLDTFPQRTRAVPASLQVAWLDGRQLIVNHQIDGSGPYQLSVLDVTNGTRARVTRDDFAYRGISVTSDRQTVLSTSADERSGIWVGEGSEPRMVPVVAEKSESPRDASFSAKGHLIYSSNGDDGPVVLTMQPGGTTSALLVKGSFPRVAGKTDTVVFVDEGRRGLYRTDLSGSRPTEILPGSFAEFDVTPDGQTVVFTGGPEQTVWAVSVGGGSQHQIAAHKAAHTPRISHDGAQFLFRASATRVVVCDFPRCSHARNVAVPQWGPLSWTPDDRGIAFTFRDAGGTNVWVQPLDGGPRRQITQFAEDRVIQEFNWSPDGQKLAVSRGTRGSDVVMLKRSR